MTRGNWHNKQVAKADYPQNIFIDLLKKAAYNIQTKGEN